MKATSTVKSKAISTSDGKSLLDLKSQVRMKLQVKKLHSIIWGMVTQPLLGLSEWYLI